MVKTLQKFASTTGYRGPPEVESVILLLTDGRSDAPTATAAVARDLKAAGNTIYAVGVSDRINYNELASLASKPEYVFTVDS